MRYYWLDAIRFIAAFVVVMVHARGVIFLPYGELAPQSQTWAVMGFFTLARLGTEAVVVFFVLSGLLVGGIGLDRIVRGEFRLRDYIIDRSSRLLLPLVPAIALTVLISYYTGVDDPGALGVIGNLLFLQGIAVVPLHGNEPLWTLAYEFWFYFALVALALLQGRRLLGFLLLMTVLLVFRYLHPIFLFTWLLGAAVYFVPSRKIPGWAGLAAALLCIAAIAAKQLPDLDAKQFDWLSKLHPTLILAFATALVLRCCSEREPPRGLRTIERGIGRLGAFSYTLYLTHYPLLALLRYWSGWERQAEVGLLSMTAYVGLVAAMVLSAYALYLGFESRTDQLKRWIKRRFGESKNYPRRALHISQ